MLAKPKTRYFQVRSSQSIACHESLIKHYIAPPPLSRSPPFLVGIGELQASGRNLPKPSSRISENSATPEVGKLCARGSAFLIFR